MDCYKITTPYGNSYETDKNGCVVRYSNGLDKTKASAEERESWKILGATSTHPFAGVHIIPLVELIALPLRHKNGAPRYTIVDRDHGTMRVIGNTRVHGIASITKI